MPMQEGVERVVEEGLTLQPQVQLLGLDPL